MAIAIFLTELCPQWLRRPIGIAVELLAGIPSIIYGIWGLFVFAPFLQQYVQPGLIKPLATSRCCQHAVRRAALWHRHADGGLILAIMVLPFIASISRDVFETVPPVLKEAAYGVGCTTWEVVRNVVIPYTRVGVHRRRDAGARPRARRDDGGDVRHRQCAPHSEFACSRRARPFPQPSPTNSPRRWAISTRRRSIELGLILFVITFIVLAISRLMLMRIERQGR